MADLKIGLTDVSDVKIGTVQVQKVMYGSLLVWQKTVTVIQTKVSTLTYANKVSGSTTANMNTIYGVQRSDGQIAFPSDGVTETAQANIDNIKTDNAVYWDTTVGSASRITQLYKIYVGNLPNVSKIVFTANGYAYGDANSYSLAVYNFSASRWELTQNHTSATESTLVLTVSSNIANYKDANGRINFACYGVYCQSYVPHVKTDYVKADVTHDRLTAPTNVQIVVSAGKCDLSWDSVPYATSYNVKRSTTSGGTYTTVGSPTGTTYSDTTVSNGTTYFYVITAVASFDESDNSSEVSGKPVSPPVEVMVNYANKITGSTTANPHIAKYNVNQSAVMLPTHASWLEMTQAYYDGLETLNGTFALTTASNTGLYSRQMFSINVVQAMGASNVDDAINRMNHVICYWNGYATDAQNSNTAYLYAYNGTDWGTAVTYQGTTVGSLNKGVINSAIDANGFVHFLVQGGTATKQTNANTRTDYVEFAVNYFTTPQTPVAITDLVGTPSNGAVGLSWSHSAGATSYNVYRSTESGTNYTQIATGITQFSYTDNTVTNETPYFYIVKGVNAVGEANPSNEISATPSASIKPMWRFVKVTMKGDSAGTTYSRPVEIRANDGSGGNSLLGVTYLSATTLLAGTYAVINDGDYNTANRATFNTNPATIVWDLGSLKPIESFETWWFADAVDQRSHNFKIEVSNTNNGTDWKLCGADRLTNTTTTQIKTDQFGYHPEIFPAPIS